MPRLNILWISHFVPYPPKGGCFQRNYNLIKEVSRDNDLYLIALRHKDKSTHPESETSKARSELEKLCKEVIIIDISSFSGLNIYINALKSLFNVNPLTVDLFKNKKVGDIIENLVGDTKFDVVHYDTISLCEYIKHSGNIPKILNHHGVESFMIRRRAGNEGNYLKKLYLLMEYYKLLKYEKNNCDKFFMNVTVSEDDKTMLQKISPGSSIEVIENGVDVDYFKIEKKKTSTNRLIFAGRMDQYSNVDAVMEFCRNIWPHVTEKYPEMRFSIIGNNPPQKLLDIARNDERLEVLGYVDDVRPHFAEATISICPIRDGGGTRLKILDAMAMGMPIISTTIGCEGIDVVPGKDLLIADTPQEFLRGIDTLLHDEALRAEMGKHARTTIMNKYSWKIIGDKLNGYYRDAASA